MPKTPRAKAVGKLSEEPSDQTALSPRDHRRLGAELELFLIDPLVGPGLPLWLPKGAKLRRVLEEHVRDEELAAGYQHVWTPHLGKEELYRTSGHYPYYKDTMFPLMKVENERYVLKPMNCPHHIRVYQARPRSYRELPMRIAEFGTMYRYEPSGVLMGLTRVRGMTLNDAHIFCAEASLEDEVRGVLELTRRIYAALGLTKYRVVLALHDPKNTKKYAKQPSLWAKSEAALRGAVKHALVDAKEVVGEAAFYGPKVDIQMTDVAGHEFTASTIQLDMLLPERFALAYTNTAGVAERPVIIHRAPIGTLERFLAFLIEHFNGAFPLWLAPVQVRVLPISREHLSSTDVILREFRGEGLRVERDDSDETLPKKIRTAETQKVPVMAIVGKKEAAAGTVSLRLHGGTDLGSRPRAEALRFLLGHVERTSLAPH